MDSPLVRIRLTEEQYTVGWICALHTELTAAIAMLDERHQRLPQDPGDDNSYILGRIGEHNVVIASLPIGEFGTNSAAHVASQMRRSFRFIRFGLMVGIGGGVPSQEPNLHLGDVVVSSPKDKNGGVVQYDRGTDLPGGFRHKGFLDAPPRVLRTAVTTLRGQQRLGDGPKFAEYLSQSKLPTEFKYPVNEPDELFERSYIHVGTGDTCVDCDRAYLVPRSSSSSVPRVYYGTIASGNRVVKDGTTRDELAAEFGALCFEMEAAGLMNGFPCIVIRGICDYADSHKNKRWQDYAAATAAAYAKELLGVMPIQEVAKVVPLVSGTELAIHTGQPGLRSMSASCLSIFTDGYLTREQLALGRLVLNVKFPGQDFCPYPPGITEADIAKNPFGRIRELVTRRPSSKFETKLNQLFSIFAKRNVSFDDINIEKAMTYQLLNSEACFEKMCGNDDTKKWLEKYLKRGTICMVVGLHTISDAAVSLNVSETSLQHTESSNSSSTGSSFFTVASFVAPDERIIAVQYRKIQFEPFSSKRVDQAYLQKSSRWKLYGVDRDDRENDAVEADLKGDTNCGDLKRVSFHSSYQTGDQSEVFAFIA
jgi:nucleoside phosphorylase